MARYARSSNIRVIKGEASTKWVPGDMGGWIRQDGDGPIYVLEKRSRNARDQAHTTGWYLYDDRPGGYFGEWCASLLLEAVDVADKMIFRDTSSGS